MMKAIKVMKWLQAGVVIVIALSVLFALVNLVNGNDMSSILYSVSVLVCIIGFYAIEKLIDATKQVQKLEEVKE